MIIFFSGDIHGRISEMYNKVLELEKNLGIKCDWLLNTGSFGIYPDPALASYAAKKHNETKEFAELYLSGKAVPRPTIFVGGSHEDYRWLNIKASKGEMELVPGLNWLVNGYSTMLVDNEDKLKALGLGKVYSPTAYSGEPVKDKKVNKRLSRYTRADVERACSQGPVDLVLMHQSAHGEVFGSKVSDSQGISKVLYATRAKFAVHGSYNYSKEYIIKATRTPALSLSTMEVVPYEYHSGRFARIV